MRCLLVLAAALSVLAGGEPLTRGERDRAMSHLHATRKMFLDSIAGLTEAQWKFKPAPNRWSIAECAEHIAISEDSLFEFMKKILQGPAQPANRAGLEEKDQEVLEFSVDRTKKEQAPAFLQPTGRWASREELIAHFKKSRDHTIAYVRDTQDDLRGHFISSGTDAYQWLLVIAGHTERHVAQINEVKAGPNYPK